MDARLAYSGTKMEQATRIATHGAQHRGSRPGRSQLTYVAAVMRRQKITPNIAVLQSKNRCRTWLTQNGD